MSATSKRCERFSIPVTGFERSAVADQHPVALRDFFTRVSLAMTATDVERLRSDALPVTSGLSADEIILAQDWCDERIFTLTGVRMPATCHPSPAIRHLKPACADLRADRDSFAEALMAAAHMAEEGDWRRVCSALEAALHEARLFDLAATANPAGVVAS